MQRIINTIVKIHQWSLSWAIKLYTNIWNNSKKKSSKIWCILKKFLLKSTHKDDCENHNNNNKNLAFQLARPLCEFFFFLHLVLNSFQIDKIKNTQKQKNQHYRKIEKEKCHLKVKTLIYTTINFDKYSIHWKKKVILLIPTIKFQ